MNTIKKIQTAKDFVAAHKNSNIDDWQPLGKSGDEKYLAIYANIVDGVYGECRTNEKCDDDGNVISHATDFEIEISCDDNVDNRSVLFTF